MITAAVWQGVESLLDRYARVRAGDAVLILYTSDSYECAAWLSAALELRGVAATRVWMAPLQDEELLARLTHALPAPGSVSGRLIVLSLERDTMSHEGTLARALQHFDPQRCEIFRAISASPELFAGPLRVSPDELSARNAALLHRCMRAERLRIATAGGTDLQVRIDSKRHRWISNRGTARAGGIVVLPAGEVATFPAAIDGIFVADCAFNVNRFTELDARLQAHPVHLWIESGCATRYECASPDVRTFLDACFAQPNAHRVGELGFGTNGGSVEAVAMNSHINERRPGIHLGFGQHNQPLCVVPYECSIHIDLIAKGAKIWVDDDPLPLDLEALTPSSEPHPAGLRDEDVFSHVAGHFETEACCGF